MGSHQGSSKKSKKRHGGDSDKSRKRRKKGGDAGDGQADDDVWVEKNIDTGSDLSATVMPIAERLDINVQTTALPLPRTNTESKLQRDDWMLEPTAKLSDQAPSTHADFFSTLGKEVKKRELPGKADLAERPKISSKELNPALNPISVDSLKKRETLTPGGPGSQWRMMRLRRVYDTAHEEGTPVEQVAVERFGSLEAFEEAKQERRILDERERGREAGPKRKAREHDIQEGEMRYMFTDVGDSGPPSRGSFRRPGSAAESAPPTPSPPANQLLPSTKRLDSLRLPSQSHSPLGQSYTPIPSVIAPPIASSLSRKTSQADDDTITLREMLRQEKIGSGLLGQKDLDAQFAKAIAGDRKFENDLDYMDDNAETLARQRMRTDAMRRQFAIHDYKRTQKVLASCPFCFGEDDSPPRAPVVAMGTRAYLSCTMTEELVPGHCLIVPIQHHLNMLEGDEDVWDEVRNFMKCLMRMFAEEEKGVVFFETVVTFKWQKHTCIECIPLRWEQFDDIPQYFKEAILQSEAEWSQHKKLIDFSARPGGFRRSMVPNLPYFMVQFDYKGEIGYGHVIEGPAEAGNQSEDGMEEGEKGGGDFPRYFAAEIIGNVLDLEPRKWRRPRKLESRNDKLRVEGFKEKYLPFDWTGMIGK